tara:strand:+ start:2859 stop:4118 length:1260 start_codon:yes stop_codon:yes gene_type:complete
MTECQKTPQLGGSSQALLWVVLLIGLAAHLPIVIPGTDNSNVGYYAVSVPFKISEIGFRVQLSAFDILLPFIVIWGWRRGWLAPPPPQVTIAVLAAVAAVIIHSIAYGLLNEQLLLARLVKESLKLIAILLELLLLVALFGRSDDMAPPFKIVLTILIVSCIIFSASSAVISITQYEPIILTRTIYATYLAGLIFLLIFNEQWRSQPHSRVYLIGACLAVIATSILLQSKTTAGLVTAILTWVIFDKFIPADKLPRISFIAAVFLIVVGAALTTSALLGANVELLQHMDTFKRSIGIRLELWSLAADQTIKSFPFGIGMGQFSSATKSVPLLAHEGHNFVHNSFLGLAVELGFIGIVIGAGIIWVLFTATRGFPLHSAPVYLIIVLPPLLIHDGHSIRILLFITALGLARYLQQQRTIS